MQKTPAERSIFLIHVLDSSVTRSTNTPKQLQEYLRVLSDAWAQTIKARLKIKILFLRDLTFKLSILRHTTVPLTQFFSSLEALRNDVPVTETVPVFNELIH